MNDENMKVIFEQVINIVWSAKRSEGGNLFDGVHHSGLHAVGSLTGGLQDRGHVARRRLANSRRVHLGRIADTLNVELAALADNLRRNQGNV